MTASAKLEISYFNDMSCGATPGVTSGRFSREMTAAPRLFSSLMQFSPEVHNTAVLLLTTLSTQPTAGNLS